MRATTSVWWGSRTDSHDSQASPCLLGPAPLFSSGQYPYSRGPSYPSRQGAGNPFAMSTSIVMNGPQYRTLSAVIIHFMGCCKSLLGWGDDPGVGLRPVLSGSRISLNSPQAFRSLASLADTADKPAKYSDGTSFSRRNSGFLKPAVQKNSEKQRAITAK